MSWNYRILDHGAHVALHEVFYTDGGKVRGWTEKPIEFVADTPADLHAMLAMALDDAKGRPVLDAAAEQRRLEELDPNPTPR